MAWNVFVLSLDADGEQSWAKAFGSHGDEHVDGLAVDSQGAVTFSGSGSGTPTLDFGSGPAFFIGTRDLYIARFDAQGNHLWDKILGAAESITAAGALAVNGSGDIYVTGRFDGAELDLGGATVSSSGASDLFLARYAPDGGLAWAKSYGTDAPEAGIALLRHPSGVLAAAGSFEGGTIDFGLGAEVNGDPATPVVYLLAVEEK